MNSTIYPKYQYNGARSLIVLHEKYIYSFFKTWQEAKELHIALPETDDKDYYSLESLLQHVLRSAAGYITWICNKLNLPDPNIKEIPQPNFIHSEAKDFISHLVDKWSTPLFDVDEKLFHSPTYTSNWGIEYCVDAMLEHAVMHPIRHEFQLRQLIENHMKSH